MMATMNSDVATGRRMKARDGLIAARRLPRWCLPLSCRPRSLGLAGGAALGPGWPVAAVGRRLAVLLKVIWAPSRSLSAPSTTTRSPGFRPARISARAIGDAKRDLAHGDGAVGVDQIDEGAGQAALDRGDRRDRHVLVLVDQKLDVDELVRVEDAVSLANGPAA